MWIPNLLSLARLLSGLGVIWLWDHQFHKAGLFVFLFAGLSDYLDGQLARRWHLQSTFGAILDAVADKVLYGIIGWYGWQKGWIPSIPFLLLILRDFGLVIGSIYLQFCRRSIQIQPNWMSKLNTTFVFIALMWTMLQEMSHFSFANHLLYLWWIIATTTIVSSLLYARWGQISLIR